MKANILLNTRYTKGVVDTRIFGSFIEHMGRVVYGGIYEPGHMYSDSDGFRTDVLEHTRKMGVSCVRYPGGNFISAHDWKDSVGPRAKRPKVIEPAWHSIETNEFGISEFMKWAKKAHVEPVFAVNLGTSGIKEAMEFLEYCNLDEGTKYSNLRKEHGDDEPYRIKYWCLGNEMDGVWQIGHKTAYEYGRLACETGRAMKLIDPSIQLSVCGSSKSSMETVLDWDYEVLNETYDIADYLSLHQYYGNQEMGTAGFLAQSEDLEDYIQGVLGVCDYLKIKKKSKKDIMLNFDEWGVWSISDVEVQSQVEKQQWQIAPAFSEQIYTMEDSLLFASMLMSFLRHGNRIKMACQSLLTNISAAIMTENNGESWLQPIYYVFSLMAKYGDGEVLQEIVEIPTYDCAYRNQVPYIDQVAIWNEEKKSLTVFVVNRHETENIEVQVEIEGILGEAVCTHTVLHHRNKKMTNKEDHNAVVPKVEESPKWKNDLLVFSVRPLSFNVICLKYN